jgi:ADP-ribosylglycohydrolase
VHEGVPAKAKDFPLFVPDSTFTDDTVLTVAVATAIRERVDFGTSIRRWGRRYPHAGYGVPQLALSRRRSALQQFWERVGDAGRSDRLGIRRS